MSLDEKEKEIQKKLLKISEVIQASRQTLRMGLGFNPISLRERILQRLESQSYNQREEGRFHPLFARRPLIERLKALRSQFQEEPKSEEDRIIEEYLREEKKKEILKKIKAQKEAEEKEKKKRELERIKGEIAVIP